MPESPISGGFSAVPPSKAMSADDLKSLVDEPLKRAAQVLGGSVGGEEIVPDKGSPEKDRPSEPEFEVDPEDRKRYIRSLLSREPFTKVYQLFGGKLKIAFRSRKSVEVDKVSAAVPQDRLKMRMTFSLIGVELTDRDKAVPVGIDDLDDIAISAIYDAFRQFEALCDEMFRRANDPDFWTATAGRT